MNKFQSQGNLIYAKVIWPKTSGSFPQLHTPSVVNEIMGTTDNVYHYAIRVKLRLKYSEKFKMKQNSTGKKWTCMGRDNRTILDYPGYLILDSPYIMLWLYTEVSPEILCQMQTGYILQIDWSSSLEKQSNESSSPPLPSSLPSFVSPKSNDVSWVCHKVQVPKLPSHVCPPSPQTCTSLKTAYETLSLTQRTPAQSSQGQKGHFLALSPRSSHCSFPAELGKQST